MADQLTPFALPFHGHRLVRSSGAVGARGARGVVFDAAYCNFPICAPSRFSMLSGRMPHAIDAFDNASEFASEIPTMAHYLRAARVSDDTRRQDAFRRAGPAARFRRAADHRHLSRGLPVGARLVEGPEAPAHRRRHGARRGRRAVRAQHADRLRRGGRARRGPEGLRPRAREGRSVLPDRVVHAPASTVRRAAGRVGPLRPARTSTTRWCRRSRTRRSIRTASGCTSRTGRTSTPSRASTCATRAAPTTRW